MIKNKKVGAVLKSYLERKKEIKDLKNKGSTKVLTLKMHFLQNA